MPSWNDLVEEMQARPDDAEKAKFIDERTREALGKISSLRRDRNVVLYASAFLQKPSLPGEGLMITHEDINGFMSVIYGMDWDRDLTLILHTPGGVTNAAESIVRYLRAKFSNIEVIVPTFAMSAGTMITLAADKIIMGRQSQLGPIDPQMGLGGGRSVSALAVVEQFELAKREVSADQSLAHVWAPILQSLGPALLQEAKNALDYSERMVAQWLSEYAFSGRPDSVEIGNKVAHHFNDANTHKSHGRRIDREETRGQGLNVEDLEDDQDLQEAVLTAYHMMTIMFQFGPGMKFMRSNTDRLWMKNWLGAAS